MSKFRLQRPVELLVVDDSKDDVRFIAEVLSDGDLFPCRLHVANDGDEAIEFLRRQGPHAQAPRPDLVLLNLYMPRQDGLRTLEIIKSDEELKDIPVVIVSSSISPRDVQACYQRHANAYIAKPFDLFQFVDMLQAMRSFWFSSAILPTDC